MTNKKKYLKYKLKYLNLKKKGGSGHETPPVSPGDSSPGDSSPEVSSPEVSSIQEYFVMLSNNSIQYMLNLFGNNPNPNLEIPESPPGTPYKSDDDQQIPPTLEEVEAESTFETDWNNTNWGQP